LLTTKIFLAVVGVAYIVLAAWCAIRPDQTSSSVGFELKPGAGQSEFLVVYGGLELGLALISHQMEGWAGFSAGLGVMSGADDAVDCDLFDHATDAAGFGCFRRACAQRRSRLDGSGVIRGVRMWMLARGSRTRAPQVLVHGREHGLIGIRLG